MFFWRSIENERRDHCCRLCGQARNQRTKIQDEYDTHPKRWAWSSAHKASEYRFSTIQRIAIALNVVKHLHKDRDGCDPHQSTAVLGRYVGAEKPFATADLHAHHNNARSNE